MALLKFTDRSGRTWDVWAVRPAQSTLGVQEPLREGWLCFQRPEGGERYRLPLRDAPERWQELPPERLDLLRRVALLSPDTGSMRQIPASEPAAEDGAH